MSATAKLDINMYVFFFKAEFTNGAEIIMILVTMIHTAAENNTTVTKVYTGGVGHVVCVVPFEAHTVVSLVP